MIKSVGVFLYAFGFFCSGPKKEKQAVFYFKKKKKKTRVSL